MERLNDAKKDMEKYGIHNKFFPKFFRFLALVADANNMEYDSVLGLLKYEIERDRARKTRIKPIE